MMKHVAPLMIALFGLCAVLASCGREDNPQTHVALPPTLFLHAEPPDVRGIVEAKEHARAGDRVTIRGRIGGSRNPFVNGRAVMTIIDLQLPTCADEPEDCCDTPWDYCCEPPSDVIAHAATVQIPGDGGGPLRAGIEGAGGLIPLAEVIVVGTVADVGSAEAFVIDAEGIYVVR